ncbi:RNA polymerase sigma factor [Pelolinea submarina]|uniref:RNA polymerase sigma-70 factor (ECF subfamily) n=1 Tax=Pelolinea submarina TaxID=913107 RepID=A0A347ZNV5_9CHLR|nr:sigma-70 family RNA polymerase sigma factor [Pelolinea submarina]REG08589.1 RNA polymerase sigma-70 factor (ECF subfamily) [Pelolinea submarina]BBB46986.1 RNA polymerase sigma-70 factor, ECF subfamily [Pelolinea submarina]
MNEKKAIKALKRGNTDALEWLIERYAGYVNTIIYNIIGYAMAVPDIEEVVSDVFLALWDNAVKVEPDKLKAYLGSIARNKAKNKLRELVKETPIEENMILISAGTPESTVLANEQTAHVKSAILAMELPDREIFLRHYYYYQGVSKIAEEMDMNVSTVKTHLARGRQKLKSILQ